MRSSESGQLGAERQRHALVGLDPEDEEVGLGEVLRIAPEHEVRRALELHGDLARPLGQALAGAQIEGHARPPPVVHGELERGVRLRDRLRRDAPLLAVARDAPAADEAGAILGADGEAIDVVGRDGPDRAHDLALLVAHGIGVEGHRRLHGDQTQELQDVVLDHVAQRAGLLVVRAARLDADALADRDLHVVDVVPVPQGLEDAVGPAEDEDVLDGLLARDSGRSGRPDPRSTPRPRPG